MNNEKQVQTLKNIFEMNIPGTFFVNYHIERPGWIDEDGGFHHGITGTFFECVMWVIETFENNHYIPKFLEEVIEFIESSGAPDTEAPYIGTMYDDNEPGEEYYVYIRRTTLEDN